MPERTRMNSDNALLVALACGASVEAAARQAGLSERTVYRRLANPDFKRQVQVTRSDMVQRAAGMLTGAAMESVKTLLALQQPAQPAAVRLGAAKAVLELGIKLREAADLEGRLAALEEQLRAAPSPFEPPPLDPPEAP